MIPVYWKSLLKSQRQASVFVQSSFMWERLPSHQITPYGRTLTCPRSRCGFQDLCLLDWLRLMTLCKLQPWLDSVGPSRDAPQTFFVRPKQKTRSKVATAIVSTEHQVPPEGSEETELYLSNTFPGRVSAEAVNIFSGWRNRSQTAIPKGAGAAFKVQICNQKSY